MRFQVPQFIEHEPKVIGPLTFRQFIFLGVPAIISFFLYFLAPFSIFIMVAVASGGIGVVLAFFKVQGRSLPGFLMGAINFFIRPKHYTWKKGTGMAQTQKVTYIQTEEPEKPKNKLKLQKGSKIKTLSTRIDTKK